MTARANRRLSGRASAPGRVFPRGSTPAAADIDRLVRAYDEGRFADALRLGAVLADRHPGAMVVHNLIGISQLASGQPQAAQVSFERALACGSRHAGVYNNLGLARAAQGDLPGAIAAYEQACRIDPGHASARSNLGNAMKDSGQLEAALSSYLQAVQLQPDFADGWCNLGLVLHQLKRVGDAAGAFGRALQIQPGHAGTLNNLGNLLSDLGSLTDAQTAYEQALLVQPDYADAWLNLAHLHKRRRCYPSAHEAYAKAVAIRPNNVGYLIEQAKALGADHCAAAAVTVLERALAIEPDNSTALMLKFHHQLQICDWTAFDEFKAAESRGLLADDAVSPFPALAFQDSPERQLDRSRAWAKAKFAALEAVALPVVRPAASRSRIRLGYFSADFHNHATMYLLAGLLREHDRSRFEIFAYSYGPDEDDDMRRHVVACVDQFHDISGLGDDPCVELVRGHGLDIAIDLKGYTKDTRVQLFASRLAPVQISYLGYPGTSGAPFIDYLVADSVVIPPAERRHYSENLILLPHSYQANDDQRPIADSCLTRADYGLPDSGFVFCCFNQNYKTAPEVFGVWMRILAAVPGSVLWLLRSNLRAASNLVEQARLFGVDPARLIFADLQPHHENLARLRHADLFLDTFNINAHTTGSDALWAGVPVVTLSGRQFAARVGASLLGAIGLDELICSTIEEYEALACDIAVRPDRLARIRETLVTGRAQSPLFQTRRYTRNLERGYLSALQETQGGGERSDIVVSDCGDD